MSLLGCVLHFRSCLTGGLACCLGGLTGSLGFLGGGFGSGGGSVLFGRSHGFLGLFDGSFGSFLRTVGAFDGYVGGLFGCLCGRVSSFLGSLDRCVGSVGGGRARSAIGIVSAPRSASALAGARGGSAPRVGRVVVTVAERVGARVALAGRASAPLGDASAAGVPLWARATGSGVGDSTCFEASG